MKKFLALSMFAAVLCAGQAKAQAISYSFVELGYLEGEIDRSGVEDDVDGFELNLSANVTESVAVVFGYQDVEGDDYFDEGTLIGLGIDYHKPYSNTGDMIFGLSYLESEVGSEDADGNEIRLEIRSRTSVQTEVHFGYLRREIDDDTESGYLFRIVNGNPRGFQFVIDYEDLDDSNALVLGLRSSF